MIDPKVRRAIEELEGTIVKYHPTASFEISRSPDEPRSIHLNAIVDVEDTDKVLDLVIDRVVELQVEERIPVHVIPIRTPARVVAAMEAQSKVARPRRSPLVSVLGEGRPAVR